MNLLSVLKGGLVVFIGIAISAILTIPFGKVIFSALSFNNTTLQTILVGSWYVLHIIVLSIAFYSAVWGMPENISKILGHGD